jgi:hypothetical protein
MRSKTFLRAEVRKKEFSNAIFRSVFGRDPNLKSDKNFLLHYLTSTEKTNDEIIEHYLDVGITKSQIAAIYETGIVPTDEDSALFPSRLLRQWVSIADTPASVVQIDRRLTPRILTDSVGEAATNLYLETSNSVIRICHLLETGAKRAHDTVVGQLFLYLLARSVHLLRSVRVLFNNDEASSILVLVRGLYECFGRLLLVNRQPDLA